MSAIDWSGHSAEEVVQAIESVPYVLGPWEPSGISALYIRHGRVWHFGKGDQKNAVVRFSTQDLSVWRYSLGHNESDTSGFASAQAAMDAADAEMHRRGWKLLGA